MDLSKSAFIQGIFPFKGKGLTDATLLEGAFYKVPFDKVAQLIYFRAGNSSKSLVNITLYCGAKPMRLFPIGAKDAMHVSLAVVEELEPETEMTVAIAAEDDAKGSVVLDIGFVEL